MPKKCGLRSVPSCNQLLNHEYLCKTKAGKCSKISKKLLFEYRVHVHIKLLNEVNEIMYEILSFDGGV